MMKKPWIVLDSEIVYQTGFMKFRVEKCELPDGRIMPKYYVIDFLDWVHVIPVTTEGELVLVRQYRQGTRREYIEFPGGSMDPRHGETPLLAAQRELAEETGYVSPNWKLLGVHDPNPALQSNRVHTFLALDCRKVSEPQLDPYEDLEVFLAPKKDLKNWISEGKINHSLMLSSLMLYLNGNENEG